MPAATNGWWGTICLRNLNSQSRTVRLVRFATIDFRFSTTKKPGLRRAFRITICFPNYRSILDLELGTAVALTAFRSIVGVDRLGLAKALRTIQAAGIHTMRGQVVVHAFGATL
jgi:hypothetical protein